MPSRAVGRPAEGLGWSKPADLGYTFPWYETVPMYDARFPVLQQYEENMWFDATGRRIAKARQQYGYGRPKGAWKELGSAEGYPNEYKVPDGCTDPLCRPLRKNEMRAAHDEFTRRLRETGWEPGGTRPPGGTES